MKIHSSLLQLQQLSSQGGQIVIYHDENLAKSGAEVPTTVAVWKSFRLKRKVVDTLASLTRRHWFSTLASANVPGSLLLLWRHQIAGARSRHYSLLLLLFILEEPL